MYLRLGSEVSGNPTLATSHNSSSKVRTRRRFQCALSSPCQENHYIERADSMRAHKDSMRAHEDGGGALQRHSPEVGQIFKLEQEFDQRSYLVYIFFSQGSPTKVEFRRTDRDLVIVYFSEINSKITWAGSDPRNPVHWSN